jgi:hypothetical protein
MSYAGEDPKLSADYSGYVLLFNEPNNIAPFGSPILPEEGAVLYQILRNKYPLAKWVIGNVSAWAFDWLVKFDKACGGPDGHAIVSAWGMHGYVEAQITAQQLISWWTQAHSILGGTFWITEWADTLGNVKNDDTIVKFFEAQAWIERYAYFTNRAKGDEPWYPKEWNVPLFDWTTGKPTKIGNWFIKGLHQVYIPIVHK